MSKKKNLLIAVSTAIFSANLSFGEQVNTYCYINEGKYYQYFTQELPVSKKTNYYEFDVQNKSEQDWKDLLLETKKTCENILSVSPGAYDAIEIRLDVPSYFNVWGLNGKYGFPLMINNQENLSRLVYHKNGYLVPYTSKEVVKAVDSAQSIPDSLTSRHGVSTFIKQQVMNKTPRFLKNKAALGGGFERGTILVKGLSQSEAKEIVKFIKGENLGSAYERLSTHGDLIWGIDFAEYDYITTPNEIFRHVIFSMPKPYAKEDQDLDNEGSSIAKEMPSIGEIEVYINNPQYAHHQFYLRIKPESYGMNDLVSIVGHTLSYLETRINNTYKKKPHYYGEGHKSTNGSFIIDVAANNKAINVKEDDWGLIDYDSDAETDVE